MSKKALISVSDKSKLKELLEVLNSFDYEFISSSGTAKFIAEEGFKVTEVTDITQFPEILGGRVKTLNPLIFGPILADRSNEQHTKDIEANNLLLIDLVIVNLYPFADTIKNSPNDLTKAIENIDIGGPSLLRAAAKNHKYITVVNEPSDYPSLIHELKVNNGATSTEYKLKQAIKIFANTSTYDQLITNHLNKFVPGFKEPNIEKELQLNLSLKQELRYGENPQQKAGLYVEHEQFYHGIANAKQLHGKELSYNNLLDISAAWNIAQEYEKEIPCVAIIKHNNPCGVAIAPSISQAYIEALSCDSVSAFGGIVACNSTVDLAAANEMSQLFLEVIIAPKFSEEALSILTQKKNIRLLELPSKTDNETTKEIRRIDGAYLIQEPNNSLIDKDKIQTVTKTEIDEALWVDLILAWKVVKHVKSNAIVVVKDGRTIGIGVGQTNRVKAVEDAVKNIDLDTRNAVLASDAFFPFADNIHLAAQHHIGAIIQPGGSVRDEEVIKACDEAKIAMAFTGIRHFKH